MVSLVLLSVPVPLGNVRQSILRPLRHVQNCRRAALVSTLQSTF